MKIEMYERLSEIGEELEMSAGEILDELLPKHLDKINGEPREGLKGLIFKTIDEDIERLERDIQFAENFQMEESE